MTSSFIVKIESNINTIILCIIVKILKRLFSVLIILNFELGHKLQNMFRPLAIQTYVKFVFNNTV